jgi:flagellar hook protein FlgE
VTQQFVELISHQRAFQANSKTITTADQMLQELMTIKQ